MILKLLDRWGIDMLEIDVKSSLELSNKDHKRWMDAIDSKTLSFKRVLELAKLHAALQEHDSTQSNGGALHIVTEDGNYDDSCIDYCIDQLESGDWKEYHGEAMTDEDAVVQLDLAKQLRELTEWEREMVDQGTTHNEDVFNLLYNLDASGIVEI